MRRTSDTDYLYASARIRAVEAGNSLHDKNEKMLSAQNFAEAVAIFGGIPETDGTNSVDYREMLDAELVKTYDFVASLTGDGAIVKIFKYPYDCNNLKLALKGEIRDVDCTEFYYTFGTVSPDGLSRAMNERDFSTFPPHMAAAARELCELVTQNADPQLIDILTDRACFEDMAQAAADFGNEYLTDVIKTKTDSYNILAFIRCNRMKKSAAFYKKVVAFGGKVDPSVLCDAYDGGPSSLADKLKTTVYSHIAEFIAKQTASPADGFFASVEKALESLYTARTSEVKFISFGPEIPISYIIDCEKEIKNAGIILAGKSVGLSTEAIRERIRK